MRITGIRAFVAFGAGQVLSIFGTSLSGFALSVWVFEQTQSVTQFALLLSFMTLPGIFARPVAGALVDRWDRRAVLLGSESIAALITLATLALVRASHLSVWHVYGMALARTVTEAFQLPATAAAMQLLVPPAQIGKATAALGLVKSLSSLVAPLITGWLLVLIGLEGVLYLDLLTFAVAVAALIIIRIPSLRSRAGTTISSLREEIVEGWLHMARRHGLVLLAVVSVLVTMVFDMARVLLTPLVLSFTTADVLGTILSAAGCGVLLGNLIILPWGGPKRRMYGILGFGALISVGLILSGLRQSALLIGLGAAIVMTGISMTWICLDAVWLSKVPPHLIGRVKGTTTMLDSVLGTATLLVAGLLADHVFEPLLAVEGPLAASAGLVVGVGPGRGTALMLLVTGVAALLLVAIALAYPRVRLVEDTLPDVAVEEYAVEAVPVPKG